MTTKITPRHTHAVVYRGAPFGANEAGCVESLHASESAARKWLDREYGNSPDRYTGQVYILALDDPEWRHDGKSPREWFGGAA